MGSRDSRRELRGQNRCSSIWGVLSPKKFRIQGLPSGRWKYRHWAFPGHKWVLHAWKESLEVQLEEEPDCRVTALTGTPGGPAPTGRQGVRSGTGTQFSSGQHTWCRQLPGWSPWSAGLSLKALNKTTKTNKNPDWSSSTLLYLHAHSGQEIGYVFTGQVILKLHIFLYVTNSVYLSGDCPYKK